MRLQAYESASLYKSKAKAFNDNRIQKRKFKPSQLVLLFNSRLKMFPRKLRTGWSGPFIMKGIRSHEAIEIENLTTKNSWIVSVSRLKAYLGGDDGRITTTTSSWDHQFKGSINEKGVMTLNKRSWKSPQVVNNVHKFFIIVHLEVIFIIRVHFSL